MVLVGTIELTLGSQRGAFYCPACRDHRSYRRKVRRAFVTLYFIPVIPLGKTAEFVICDTCRQPFEPWVLERPADEIEAMLRAAACQHILRVMILTMLADEVVSDEEDRILRSYYRHLSGEELTNEQLQFEIEQLTASGLTPALYGAQAADELTDREREEMVIGAFLVASASGPLSDAQLDELQLLPAALGIDENRYREIIAEAMEFEGA